MEVKLAVPGAAEGRARLERAGFVLARERAFESNTVFDTPGRQLRRSGLLLRLRTCGGTALLTYKGPASGGRHKTREELETGVTKPQAVAAILELLGFEPSFRYEKYRTEYARTGEPGHVLLDETPAGDFLELEGPPEWIDAAAAALGFTPADYITATYAELWAQRHSAGALPDMVF